MESGGLTPPRRKALEVKLQPCYDGLPRKKWLLPSRNVAGEKRVRLAYQIEDKLGDSNDD